MKVSSLLTHFPPPRFLVMDHAGLEISDDSIRCISFIQTMQGMRIGEYASIEIPPGIIEAGDIKDETEFKRILKEFAIAHDLSHVKVSIPEEKAYMFQTDVPSFDPRIATQNIEFKLEENVPLSASAAVFYFDYVPQLVTPGPIYASVSVVPRSYIDNYISVLSEVGLIPIAFEIVPTAVARAIGSGHESATELIVHSMKRKTGIYIVSGGSVMFTSTIAHESGLSDQEYANFLTKEVARINSYWMSRNATHGTIGKMILVGDRVSGYQTLILKNEIPQVEVGDVWKYVLNVQHYTPPLSNQDSLSYVVATGLAIELS